MNREMYTFWELLQKYRIEIPTIQRDYTYGRPDAQKIGEKLITDFIEALTQNKNLHLDFIYGKLEGKENFQMLERNQSSIETILKSVKSYAGDLHLTIDYEISKTSIESSDIVTFIPLDGQQRLTTLFLLHWFLAINLEDKASLDKLSHFTYSTRDSSRAFIQLLCSGDILKSTIGSRTLIEFIKEHEHFFSFWKNDPTVNSMLFMIDQIEKFTKKKEVDLQQCFLNLTEEKCLSFDFFDLDDFELTDELYVKMNARGKPLVDFENFKAWLVKNFKNKIGIQDWEKKLDIEWNDLFWNLKKKGQTKIEDEYFQYFLNMYLSDYLLLFYKDESEEKEINADEPIKRLRTAVENPPKSNTPVQIFESNQIFSDNISNYLILLDTLDQKSFDFKLNPIFNEFNLKDFLLKSMESLNWPGHTYQYALKSFILIYPNKDDELKEWARVIGNLIYNTPIETAYLHRNACLAVNELLKKIGDNEILDSISKLKEESLGFANDQTSEEIKKALLIKSEPEIEWRELFFKYEQHDFFYGKIGFIFNLVDELNFEKFQEVAEKLSALFSEDVMQDDTNMLFRACLAIPIFNPRNEHKLIYPSNSKGTLRLRNENWRRFILKHPEIIKAIINHPLFNNTSPLQSLEKIIQNSSYGSEMTELMALNPELLKYPKKNQIRFFEHTCLLLNSSKISGKSAELFTYDWYIKRDVFKKQYSIKNEIGYHFGKGENDIPGLELHLNGLSYKIIYERNSGKLSVLHGKLNEFQQTGFNSINEAIQSII